MKKILKSITILSMLVYLIGCGNSSGNNNGSVNNSNYAYVTDFSELKVIDIRDAQNPILTSSLPLPTSYHVSIVDKFAYVFNYDAIKPYVSIIDVSNPLTPTVSVNFPKGNNFRIATDIYTENGIAYVTDTYKGVHAVDISNGTFTPQSQTEVNAMSVTKMGNNLYLLYQGTNNGLQIFNISSPYTLTATTIMNTTDIDTTSYGMPHHSIVKHNNTDIFVANISDKKLKKLDSSDLTLISSVNINGFATDLAIHNNFAFVTMHNSNAPLNTGDDAIKVINLTNMTITDTKTLNEASSVSVYDNKVFVTDSTALHIYQVDNNGNLNLLSTLSSGFGNAIRLGE